MISNNQNTSTNTTIQINEPMKHSRLTDCFTINFIEEGPVVIEFKISDICHIRFYLALDRRRNRGLCGYKEWLIDPGAAARRICDCGMTGNLVCALTQLGSYTNLQSLTLEEVCLAMADVIALVTSLPLLLELHS
ncbi:hypothetical protein GGI21_002455 [Coemansia aciculifera]|nr:hypothetical protein GGI21_002455 [Coemansia aciculifera]